MKKVLILGVLVVLCIATAPVVSSQGNASATTPENVLGLSQVSKPTYDMDTNGNKSVNSLNAYSNKQVNSLDAYGDKQVNNLNAYGNKPVYSLGMRTAAKPVYDTSSLSGKNAVFDVRQRRGTPASINYTMGLAKTLYNVSDFYRFRPVYDIPSYFRAKPLYSIGT
jgi:hypothetical protein